MGHTLPPGVQRNVILAPYTTLELGGAAEYFYEASDEDATRSVLAWAHRHGIPVSPLGAGSNVLISDDGIPGLVLAIRLRGRRVLQENSRLTLETAAGEPWDEIVEHAVSLGGTGLECLSGIPGLVGATPVQNVGAYGQEIADTLVSITAWDHIQQRQVTMSRASCQFGYRTSVFKQHPGRWIVLSVTFSLARNQPPTLVYPELRRATEALGATPSTQQIRETVLALRRSKSMLLDPRDPNHRSAGSFFLNPVVSPAQAYATQQRLIDAGVIQPADTLPQFPTASGDIKIPAAWLIERAGFYKGQRFGSIGISSRHALCLVHHGGGTAQALLQLAQHIQQCVLKLSGILLIPEPVYWGPPDPQVEHIS